jgi:hypothetical protein
MNFYGYPIIENAKLDKSELLSIKVEIFQGIIEYHITTEELEASNSDQP